MSRLDRLDFLFSYMLPVLCLAVRPQALLPCSRRSLSIALSVAPPGRALLTMSASMVACERTGSRSNLELHGVSMSELVIKTKTGIYGRVNITLPLPVKLSMLSWQKKSGMNKAQFFRTALMMGALQLANDLHAKDPDTGYFDEEVTSG